MKIPFLFGIHCHQPAENFYNVVDWAINESYAPFIEVALKNKKFKFSAHYSGWLLEYIIILKKSAMKAELNFLQVVSMSLYFQQSPVMTEKDRLKCL